MANYFSTIPYVNNYPPIMP